MKNAIIIGASGMIGSIILQKCLDDAQINSITAIGRKNSGIEHPKLKEVVIHDFKDYTEHESLFENQDIAYFCLGVYTGAVERDMFRTITVDYSRAFAETIKKKSPNACFCFLSGQGADQSEKSRMMFAKDKGIAENILIRLGFKETYIFRPAYIYPVTKRKEPNTMYTILRKLYPLLKTIYPNGVISSEQLAEAMFKAGLKGTPKMILENKDIKNLV